MGLLYREHRLHSTRTWLSELTHLGTQLNRLFIRYGSVSQLPDNMAQYKPFASNFEQNFAPEIFKAYLRQVELSLPTSDNRQWLSQRCQKLVVDFLEECVKPKSTWALLRPQLPLLISHFLFPLLCPTDDELSLFEDDPLEWVQNHFSLFSEDIVNKPEYSVLGLFDTLVACRKSSTLAPLVSFSTSVVSEYPQQRSAKEKEGALKIFHALARPICKTVSGLKQCVSCCLTDSGNCAETLQRPGGAFLAAARLARLQ